jgi:hypothetical protein
MDMILYITNPHSFFLVTTHHCHGFCNAHLIHPVFSSVTRSSFVPSSRPPSLFGLLELHVRQGDNIIHCTVHISATGLHATWASTSFQGCQTGSPHLCLALVVMMISDMIQRQNSERAFVQTAFLTWNYLMHARGVHVAATNHETHAPALLTNRRPEWLEELKDTLQEDATREGLGKWKHIRTSRDLRLTGEQKHNSQAVDMVVAQLPRSLSATGYVTWLLFVAVVC